jgi:DNA-binding beta-propeller fold protein YncE
MKITTLTINALALVLFAAATLVAADPAVETVVDGLYNPSGVAVQPETGDLFVSDSGAGRVIRVVDGKAQDVIVGFSKDVYGKGPMFDIGPLGLVFLNKDTLVVGGGDKPDGEELLRVFTVPAAGSPAIQAGDAVASFNMPATDDVKGEGNFYGLAATKQAIFVTCNGDDTKGWVSRASIQKGKVTDFKRFLATKEATDVDAPVAATISPKGQLVVGQGGEVTVPKDSLLTFYNAKTGKMLLNLPTGLYDITGLAYSGDGKTLFATDFAWMATAEGGLFQLVSTNDNGKQAIEAKKLVSLDKPTALAIQGDTIYVTVFGTPAEGSDAKSGKLVKVTVK